MKLLKSEKGEMVINITVILMAVMYTISLGLHLYPVFIRYQQMQTYANEICRVAEISGRIGSETTTKEEKLNQEIGITPDVVWNTSGQVQLNGDVNVTCSTTVEIGNFGGIASVSVPVYGHASGQSEVYWK